MDGVTMAERLRLLHPDCGIVFCTGHAQYAVDAIGRLRVDGYLIKPIDREAIVAAAKETGHILTLEEHNLSGGVGSAVAEVLADENAFCHFRRLALPDVNVSLVGSQDWLREQYGLGVNAIADAIVDLARK